MFWAPRWVAPDLDCVSLKRELIVAGGTEMLVETTIIEELSADAESSNAARHPDRISESTLRGLPARTRRAVGTTGNLRALGKVVRQGRAYPTASGAVERCTSELNRLQGALSKLQNAIAAFCKSQIVRDKHGRQAVVPMQLVEQVRNALAGSVV